eukprot:1962470-Pyramimonas_sp.AAC.1
MQQDVSTPPSTQTPPVIFGAPDGPGKLLGQVQRRWNHRRARPYPQWPDACVGQPGPNYGRPWGCCEDINATLHIFPSLPGGRIAGRVCRRGQDARVIRCCRFWVIR